MSGRSDLEQRVWLALRELVLHRGDRRRHAVDALGMSYQRVKALQLVAGADPPLAHHELAARLLTDKPYTTVIVRDLIVRGLVTSEVNPRDGRSKIVTVTPSGARLAGRAAELMNTPPAEIAELADADLAALERIVIALGGGRPAG